MPELGDPASAAFTLAETGPIMEVHVIVSGSSLPMTKQSLNLCIGVNRVQYDGPLVLSAVLIFFTPLAEPETPAKFVEVHSYFHLVRYASPSLAGFRRFGGRTTQSVTHHGEPRQ